MVCNRLVRKYAKNFIGIFLVTCLGCVQAAIAGGLTISPVLLELDSPRKAIAVTLSNGGDTTLTFQSSALVWQQIDGADQYTPTDAVLVAPAIIEIPPQSSQVFRVALRKTEPTPMEQSYRLLLEDVSRPQSDADKPAVALRLIHSLPLLVAPTSKTTVGLRWSPCSTQSKSQSKSDCVRITNVGNRHIKVKAITVSGETWQQQLDTAVTLLAGAWREWQFDSPNTNATITTIAVKNERDVLIATREIIDELGTSDAVTAPVTVSCLSISPQDDPYAQASAQSPGTTAAYRTADLQPCASDAVIRSAR